MGQELQRWRLDISYDGKGFSGWAVQPNRRTVQADLENWISLILRLDQPVTVVCAGRTDAGVHARGQVAHVDLPDGLINDGGSELHRRLAKVLPADVVVRAVRPAPDGFHARFSASWRRYTYRLLDGDDRSDPLLRSHVVHHRHLVDLELMNKAGVSLLGLHDFAAFCRKREGATTIRTLLELSGSRVASGPLAGTIEFKVKADAFCRSMVRSLIGALVAVGIGKHDLDWLRQVSVSAVRDSRITVMPAHGLTLEEVRYPADDQLLVRSIQSRVMREVPR